MNGDATTIVTGMIILFLVSYLLITLFNFVFMAFTKDAHKVKGAKLLMASAISALAWVIATLLAVFFVAELGIVAFSVFALVVIFGANFFLSEKLVGVAGRDKIVYCAIFAVLFNPGWLTLVGIL